MKDSKLMPRMIHLLIIVAFLNGCAAFQSGTLPKLSRLSLPEVEEKHKKSIQYTFSAESTLFNKKKVGRRANSSLVNEMVDEFEDSGLVSHIGNNLEDPDLFLDVKFSATENPWAMIPAFISGYSLTTIPCWGTILYELTAQIKDQSENTNQYTLENKSTTVVWLPMIVVMPFQNPFQVPIEVRKNLYRNLILKMKEDGFLGI